jgi:hypothetical protein
MEKKNSGGNPQSDASAEYPGEQSSAYDQSLSDETFLKKFTGSMGDLASITFSDGTQCHGKLVDGFKPAAGYVVDANGMVLKVSGPGG